METYLRKFGLLDDITLTLKTDKQTFARRLAKNVDAGDIGLFSGAFEAWEASNNDYKGQVTNNGFTIRQRKTFLQAQGISMPTIRGTFKEEREDLIIEAEIKPHTKFFIPVLIIGLAFYVIFILAFALSVTSDENGALVFIIPVILFHMCLMLGIPYFLMKRGVTRTKKNLKRDFFYIAHG